MFELKRGINFPPLHGWNIGEDLAQEKYLLLAKEAGFDHIRYPYYISWTNEEPDNRINSFQIIRDMAEMTLRCGLIPIVDIHGFEDLNGHAHELCHSFVEMWSALAETLQDLDESVIFEIFNEPSGQLDDPVFLNELQNQVIRAIRRTNPTRTILAATAHMNVIENLPYLQLPEDDKNIVVTIHDYTPMEFTHQGADWCVPEYPTGVHWRKTQEECDLLRKRMDMAAEWAKKNNRKLLMGEFGVFDRVDMEERAAWTEYMVKLMEERGIAWSYWAFAHTFSAYDIVKDCWIEPILNALMVNVTKGK